MAMIQTSQKIKDPQEEVVMSYGVLSREWNDGGNFAFEAGEKLMQIYNLP